MCFRGEIPERKGSAIIIQRYGGKTMEKVVNELRVIETDDGFRIEVKGDKEQIKAFMSGFDKHKAGSH